MTNLLPLDAYRAELLDQTRRRSVSIGVISGPVFATVFSFVIADVVTPAVWLAYAVGSGGLFGFAMGRFVRNQHAAVVVRLDRAPLPDEVESTIGTPLCHVVCWRIKGRVDIGRLCVGSREVYFLPYQASTFADGVRIGALADLRVDVIAGSASVFDLIKGMRPNLALSAEGAVHRLEVPAAETVAQAMKTLQAGQPKTA